MFLHWLTGNCFCNSLIKQNSGSVSWSAWVTIYVTFSIQQWKLQYFSIRAVHCTQISISDATYLALRWNNHTRNDLLYSYRCSHCVLCIVCGCYRVSEGLFYGCLAQFKTALLISVCLWEVLAVLSDCFEWTNTTMCAFQFYSICTIKSLNGVFRVLVLLI